MLTRQEARGQAPQLVINDRQESIQGRAVVFPVTPKLLQQQGYFVRHKKLSQL